MSKKYLIGVDLGSTAFKAGLFDDTGKKVSTHTEEHKLITPYAQAVEQSAEVYWDTFKTCVRSVIEKSGVDKESVLSLSLSSQGETLVFLDENMQPLHNFIVWMDIRPQEEAEIINGWFSPGEILKRTGQGPITSLYPACKVLWFKRNFPEEFKKIHKILLLDDYMFYRMGGVLFGEGSNWCTSYMWDINTGTYWPEMLRKLEISEIQLPKTVKTGTPLGKILPEAAAELGLPETLELVMGGLDQSCGTIGVGNVRPGIFSESTGAALVICTMTNEIVLDEGGELPCFYGVIPGLFMLHAGAKGGIMLRWLRDTLCKEELNEEENGSKNAYAAMDAQAAQIHAGSDGLVVLPFFGGSGAPVTDQYAKGM
ncbi:MAG: FGGY family carbohydrate kinase, partial [Bacillota bacterium]|nr:FGGY family carbohydrate kinase [Bacillota bacterium]